MAKGAIAMIVKLKCMIRVWRNHSKSKPTTSAAQLLLSPPPPPTADTHSANSKVRPVYVGQSRRLYQLSPHLVEHPLFRVLVQKSGGTTSNEAAVVDCEVVLFEHFLWMLENNYDEIKQPAETLEEIVGFYTSMSI